MLGDELGWEEGKQHEGYGHPSPPTPGTVALRRDKGEP